MRRISHRKPRRDFTRPCPALRTRTLGFDGFFATCCMTSANARPPAHESTSSLISRHASQCLRPPDGVPSWMSSASSPGYRSDRTSYWNSIVAATLAARSPLTSGVSLTRSSPRVSRVLKAARRRLSRKPCQRVQQGRRGRSPLAVLRLRRESQPRQASLNRIETVPGIGRHSTTTRWIDQRPNQHAANGQPSCVRRQPSHGRDSPGNLRRILR